MHKIFSEKQLLIATSNQGKLKEIEGYFANFPLDLYNLSQFSLTTPEETGYSFEENSYLKAKYYSDNTGLPTLSDDSGIEIVEIGNRPGIHSADWAGLDNNYEQAINQVKQELIHANKKDLTSIAYFSCAITLFWPNGDYETFTGKVKGNICVPPRGENGFGYDSIFIPENSQLTFAEMTKAAKQQISHRSRALSLLITNCFSKI
jgi:XTP/dITP diphosphohydrolase